MPASATASPSAPGSATHIARKRALARDDMVAIARHGAAESLAAGITTTADYSFSGAAATPPPSWGCGRSSTSRSSGPTRRSRARFEELRARFAETELVRRHLTARAVHLLARRLPLLPLARHPGRTHLAESAARTSGSSTGPGRSRRPPTCSSRPRASAPSRRSRRCSGPTCSAPTASRRRRRDRAARGAATSRSRTARARTRCSAAASRRSPACARPASASASARTRRRRRPRSTPGTSCGRRCRRRARERRPDALSADGALRLATLDAARASASTTSSAASRPGSAPT